MAVTQNFENEASMKTGRTGGLPYVGIGWYRTVFRVPHGRRAVLLFDGAMSEARVYVNGEHVCFWPYGYNSFWCDVTDVLTDGDNVLAVRLENLPQSSRWYPGAGLYRNVHLITTGDVHIPVWGTRVTTPDVDFALAEDYAWTLGQFVWTGFDYLGEPSPYDTDSWPNHSSVFGIIDLASIPKDRFWLYRSVWNFEIQGFPSVRADRVKPAVTWRSLRRGCD